MAEYVITIRVEASNMAEAITPFLWDETGEPKTNDYIGMEVAHG